MSFLSSLKLAQAKNNSLLCVGLDPDTSRIPAGVSIYDFLKKVIDETHDLVCAYKPQIAYFASYGGEKDLENIVTYIHSNYPDIPVIVDAKRGDIGSTAGQYAREVFERYGFDAVTVNPYLGYDSFEPFLAHKEKGVIILCKTSNPGSGDFQNMTLETGRKLYEEVAYQANHTWNEHGNILLVVGGTYPEEIARVRTIVGDDMFFLIPGIGAQWWDIEATVRAARNSHGSGMIINSARAILYPASGTSREEAIRTRDEINKYRQ